MSGLRSAPVTPLLERTRRILVCPPSVKVEERRDALDLLPVQEDFTEDRGRGSTTSVSGSFPFFLVSRDLDEGPTEVKWCSRDYRPSHGPDTTHGPCVSTQSDWSGGESLFEGPAPHPQPLCLAKTCLRVGLRHRWSRRGR